MSEISIIPNVALSQTESLTLPSKNSLMVQEDSLYFYDAGNDEMALASFDFENSELETQVNLLKKKGVEKNDIILTLLCLERQIQQRSQDQSQKVELINQVKKARMDVEDEGNLSVLQYVNTNMKAALDKTPFAQALLQMATDAERHLFEIDSDKEIIEKLKNIGVFDTFENFEEVDQQIFLRFFGQQSAPYNNLNTFKNSNLIARNFDIQNEKITSLFQLQSKVAGELNPLTRVVKGAKRYGMMAGSIDTYFGLNDIDVLDKMEQQKYYKSSDNDDKQNLKKAAIQLANLDSPLTKDQCNFILQSGTDQAKKSMLEPFQKLYNNDIGLSDNEFEKVKEFVSLKKPWSASGMNQRAGAIANDLGNRFGNVLYSGQFNELFSAPKLNKQDFIDYTGPLYKLEKNVTTEIRELKNVPQEDRDFYYSVIQSIPFKDNETQYNNWKENNADDAQRQVPYEMLMMWHQDSETHNHRSFFDTPAFTGLEKNTQKDIVTQIFETVNKKAMYQDEILNDDEADELVSLLDEQEEGTAWKEYLNQYNDDEYTKDLKKKDLIMGVKKMFEPYNDATQNSKLNNGWTEFVENAKRRVRDVFQNKAQMTSADMKYSFLDSTIMNLSDNSTLKIRDLYIPKDEKMDALLNTIQDLGQNNAVTKFGQSALRNYILKPADNILENRNLKGFLYLPQLKFVPERTKVELPKWLRQEMDPSVKPNYDDSATELYSQEDAFQILQSLYERSLTTFNNNVLFGPETNAVQSSIAGLGKELGKTAFATMTKEGSGRALLNNTQSFLLNNTLTQAAREFGGDINKITADQYSKAFYKTLLDNPVLKMVDGVLKIEDETVKDIEKAFNALSGDEKKYVWNNQEVLNSLNLASGNTSGTGYVNADSNRDGQITLEEYLQYYVENSKDNLISISDAIMGTIANQTITDKEKESLQTSAANLLNIFKNAKGATLASAQYGTSFVSNVTDELSLQLTSPDSLDPQDLDLTRSTLSRNPNLLLSRLKSVLQMSSNAIGLQVFENNGNFYIKNSENTNYDRLNTKEGFVTLLDTLGWKAAQFYVSPRSAYYQAYASMALDTLSSYMPFGDPTKTWSFFQWWDDEITDNNGEKVRVPKGLSDTFKKTVVSAAGLAGFLASHGITALWLWDSYQSLSRPTYQVKEQYSIVQSQIVTARAEAEWTNSKWEQTVLRTLTQSEESLKGIKRAMRTHASLNAPLNESNSERLRDQRLMGDNVTGVVTNPFEMRFDDDKDEWIRKLCLFPWSRFLSELNEFDGSVFVYDEVQNSPSSDDVYRTPPSSQASSPASSPPASPAPATTSSSMNVSTFPVTQASAPSTNTTSSSNKELRREAISNEWSDYTQEVNGSYIKLVKVALQCRMGNSEGNNSDDFIDNYKTEFGLRYINDLKKIITIEQ
tara:strand:- start:3639 stop:7856 length:4218 start_codon:yes stop_codon:yes gene_type:complete